MTSSSETPILIDSDHDSDVEIVREEKNEDLDIIFVSETIHVKEEDKPTSTTDFEPETRKSDPTGGDIGFNRSLSISSNLDITLCLNDNPQLQASDQAPLDLSSKTEYDDITDSSDEDSLSSSDDDLFHNIKGPDKINTGSLLSDKVLSIPLGTNDVFNCSRAFPKINNNSFYNLTNNDSKSFYDTLPCSSTGTSTTSEQETSQSCQVLDKNSRTTHKTNSTQTLNFMSTSYCAISNSNPSNSVLSKASNQMLWTDSVPSTSKQRLELSQTLDNRTDNSGSISINSGSNSMYNSGSNNMNNSGSNGIDNRCGSHGNGIDFCSDAEKLLQDLDFLNSTILTTPDKCQNKALLQDISFFDNSTVNTTDKSHPKLCRVLSMPDDYPTSSAQIMTGVKRTLSEKNQKSKSDDKILPPKKQTRYLKHQSSDEMTWGSEKCSHCQMSLLGCKVSRCLQGHPSCTTCLEEKVKVVLTAKARETLHCLKIGCDSFFPLNELNHSLPKMVVDILETKLDDDYIDYIASMILKNATSSDDCAQNLTTQEVPAVPDLPEIKKTSCLTEVKQERNKDLPANWTYMDKKTTYECVVLEPESPEYVDVVFKFHESMKFPVADIVKISRIQNPILWQYYNVKRAQMILENEGVDVEERRLFHGTHTSVVESICKKGFDWRVCGKNGTVYGQGSYFAVNSSYSHQYADKGNRRGRLPRRHSCFVFKPPPAHSGSLTGSRMLNMQLLQMQNQSQSYPFLGSSIGPSFISQTPQPSAYLIGSGSSLTPQTSQNPPLIISPSGTSQQSSCILFGQPTSTQNIGVTTQPSVIVNHVNSQGATGQQTSNQNIGAPSQGGINTTSTTGPVVAGNLPAKTVIINSQGGIIQQNVPINQNRNIQGGYGQPQVNVNTQRGGYVQPQFLFQANNPNYGLGTKHEEDKPTHKMILSRVLVGRFTGGNANLRKPPPLFPDEDVYGKCYDSCVDHISEPKIFVIFDSAQAYPEYLIEYNMMSD